MHIPIFGLIMIFVLWLGYEIKAKTKNAKQQTEDFWEKERKSGFVPRQSTEDIHFITIEDTILPKTTDSNNEIDVAVNGILALKDKPIADLSEYTNTDLKLKYGTGNFTKLSEADTNFISLTRLLGKAITTLYEEGRLAEAEAMGSFALKSKVFTTSCTIPLASIYAKLGDTEKLDAVLDAAISYGKCPDSLINKLKEIRQNV